MCMCTYVCVYVDAIMCVRVYYSVHCKTKIFNKKKNSLWKIVVNLHYMCHTNTHIHTPARSFDSLGQYNVNDLYRKRFKGLGCQCVQCKRRLHVDVYYDCMYTGI